VPEEVMEQIQNRMTASAGHIRELNDARRALQEAIELYRDIQQWGFKLERSRTAVAGVRSKPRVREPSAAGIIRAIQAEHLALTSVAYLKAIVELLGQGSGSRGSHLVVAEDGIEIHADVIDKATNKPLKFKPENKSLRNSILQIEYDESLPDLFRCKNIELRPATIGRKAFEPAWQDYREGKIYS